MLIVIKFTAPMIDDTPAKYYLFFQMMWWQKKYVHFVKTMGNRNLITKGTYWKIHRGTPCAPFYEHTLVPSAGPQVMKLTLSTTVQRTLILYRLPRHYWEVATIPQATYETRRFFLRSQLLHIFNDYTLRAQRVFVFLFKVI
jgi:hypothetical protein